MAEALRRGYRALALTDECSLSGVVRAHEAARPLGLHLIIGAHFCLTPSPGRPGAVLAGHGAPHLVLLAQTHRGYSNLSQWISVARRRAPKGQYLAYPSDLEGRVPTAPFLAGLPGCFALLLPQPGQMFETVFAHAMWLKTWFGGTGPESRCAIAIELLHRPHDALRLEVLPRVAALSGLPLVACGDVLMHSRARKPLQDVLTATRLKLPVAACGLALAPNAEAHLRSRARLAGLYAPEWLAASVKIAASCTFSLTELCYEYPEEVVPAGHTPTSWLRELTEQGLLHRYPAGVPDLARTAIERELALIAQLGFDAYFLTVADIVQWARAQGILCQGRGSAANSVVCFCLGVTELNPQADGIHLLFERFISAERNEPPDIDIDFEHQRREEVIQYLYRKYGRHRAALTGVMISYRPRSALRDVGRALGIDLDRIAAVSKGQHWWIDDPQTPAASPPGGSAPALGRPGARRGATIAPDRLREQGLDPDSLVCRQWLALTQQLIGFPRHLSQHPGGFVIARDDISRLVPVENAAMDDRTVIQWDKDDLDALGLIKVDILALGMLSVIRRALTLVGAKLGQPGFDMQSVPAGDVPVYDMLCRGDSVGTFQVESRAQMSMLPRLQPRCYYDLVIEVAIVRPGPIQGGMVHPYLRRRSGEEPVDYPSAEVRQALGRTLGVPIFQEQVMQLAILAADFTPGEADSLRRAMAAWKRKGGIGPFHERLVGRMVAKGYTADYAERIFKQIEGFGEYGFPESHAASFALLVYVSARLKCHHPDAFLAALLNSQPMGFYAPAQLVRDAREHGVAVLPVDVLRSEWHTVLEPAPTAPSGDGADAGPDFNPDFSPNFNSDSAPFSGPDLGPGASRAGLRPVRLGFNRLIGFNEADARRLVAARGAARVNARVEARVEARLAAGSAGQGGAAAPFTSIEDLARHAGLGAHALQLLAQGDALAPLVGHRHQAAWAVRGVDSRATALLQATRTQELPATLAAPAPGLVVLADYRSTGLSLSHHPLALLRHQLAAFRVQPAAVLVLCRHGQLARASGLVTHRQRPGTANGVVFVTLEDDTGAVNVVVWPTVATAQRVPLLASTLLTVYGVWQRVGDNAHAVRHLVAYKLIDHSALLHGLVSKSRDFH